METISQRWAKFALELKYENIPSVALKEAKRFLLDSVGCAFSALDNKDTKAAYNYIRDLGGKEQATIIGWGEKTNLPLATLMNSLLIRALDYNDIYWEQDPSHPSDISPAVLSTGEFMKKNGKEVLVGIIIAYELEMRLCLAAFPGVREIGWHHATLTQFVSPVVAGKMLGLSEKEIVAAIGISGSSHLTLGGVVAGHLTNMKNAADSFAVEAGVRAALLASKGFTGPVEVFEGKEGLFEVLDKVKWNKDVLTKGLGEEFLINQCGYKAFPTEALTHQPITAAIEVMKENNLDPKEIKEVLVETTTRGADILSDPSKYKPTTKETADHSLPYCIAVAVAKGNVLPSDFKEDALRDPFVWALLDKIKVVANPEIDDLFPKVKRAIVTIKTSKGEFKKQEDFAKGQPERLLSEEELISKFKANSEKKISSSRMENIIKTTQELENINEIGKYMELLVSDK
ncbi:MmgE/PrpD family protein [bacterium]|nr:MmgE/PrpD family protein [bacterium]MBU4361885.1 MmgE/PrpD family protein [bacterium]MBU4414969.1 MmgE/PrpD family protein [Pseudomonadota bacterium]MBU4602814.1 MmgE/PrpD family protein [bacterium]MCG2761941.1 MmgE/PrpD family protein [Candidatus Atribacteria bacterium]